MKKKLYLIIVILLLMSSGVIIYIKNLNNIIIEGNNARNNINNQQIQDNENKKEEIFNYIAEELPKIVNESQPSIFIKSNEHEDMVAINSVQSGSTQYDGKTVYFLNAEASSMDIDIGLKNDLINNILFTLNYKGQYYEAYVKKPKLRYYYGKIIYEIDISNYSNIIPLIDKRYINDNLAVSNGTEPNADYSNGHFSVHLENGEFSNSKLVYKSSSIFSDNKRLNDEFKKYIEENLANKMEQESNNTNESAVIEEKETPISSEDTAKELTQEEKKSKAKEALDTIYTEFASGEGAGIEETFLNPIKYSITARYTVYDNDDIKCKIEKVVVTNQQTGESAEVIHTNEYDYIGSAQINLVDGSNTIIFTFYDNYGNTKQIIKTTNKLSF